MNARVTFGNIFSLTQPFEHVTPLKDETTCACVIDESAFEIPANYSYLGRSSHFLPPSASLKFSLPNTFQTGDSWMSEENGVTNDSMMFECVLWSRHLDSLRFIVIH